MKLEQLICKKCGEYLVTKNTSTNEIVSEEEVKASFNNETITCSHCDRAITVKN